MALPSFCNKEVTVWRASYITERGSRVRDWENATPHSVPGCSVQPVNSSVAWQDTSQAVTVRLVLRLPPNSDIKIGDRVEIDGTNYAIDGAPHVWESPSGRVSHIECSLIDWQE